MKFSSEQPPLQIEGLEYIRLKAQAKNGNNTDNLMHRYVVTGNIKKILSELSNLPAVDDIILPEPNVEDYFMKFYTGE